MPGIVVATDPIEVAKELAIDFELTRDYTEESINGALQVMNSCLRAAHFDSQSIVKAAEAYQLPDDEVDIEFMPDEFVSQLKIEGVMVKGKIGDFKWFGSLSLSAFGIRMYGVDFYKPEYQTTDTLFVPVETIELRLAA